MNVCFRKLKVVHLSSVHVTFDTRIFYKECRFLAAQGHNVTLVIPGDRNEVRDGVRISVVRRPSSRWERFILTGPNVFYKGLKQRADIYHIHDPELIPYGLILSCLGKTVIYDCHEDVPKDILGKKWIPEVFRKTIASIVRVFMNYSLRCFDSIIAATPSIEKSLESCRKPIYVVQNFPSVHDVEKEAIPFQERKQRILYVGDLTSIRGIREMVNAVALIPEMFHAKLAIVGKFSENDLESDITKSAAWLNCVEFYGWRDRESVRDIMRFSKIGLVLFHPVPNHIESQPNKLFEYMAAGIPVIASDFSHWKQFIVDHGCGILVNPFHAEQVADACVKLLSNDKVAEEMGRKGQHAILNQYNWENEANNLLHAYSSVKTTVTSQ